MAHLYVALFEWVQAYGLFGATLFMLVESAGAPFPTELGFIASQGEAEDRRDALRKTADKKAKKGKRPCLCCGRAFDSDGIHNRLCQPCKGRGYATWETA